MIEVENWFRLPDPPRDVTLFCICATDVNISSTLFQKQKLIARRTDRRIVADDYRMSVLGCRIWEHSMNLDVQKLTWYRARAHHQGEMTREERLA